MNNEYLYYLKMLTLCSLTLGFFQCVSVQHSLAVNEPNVRKSQSQSPLVLNQILTPIVRRYKLRLLQSKSHGPLSRSLEQAKVAAVYRKRHRVIFGVDHLRYSENIK